MNVSITSARIAQSNSVSAFCLELVQPRKLTAGAAGLSPMKTAVGIAAPESGGLRGIRDLEPLLDFYDVPEGHWKKVRTTNVNEGSFREVRRRTRPMSSFSNPASYDRIVFGVISPLNRSWEKKPFKEFTHSA
jgi:Transposase, Mutator family